MTFAQTVCLTWHLEEANMYSVHEKGQERKRQKGKGNRLERKKVLWPNKLHARKLLRA